MNVKILFVSLLAALALTACHEEKKPVEKVQQLPSYDQPLKGDSTIYGLACEGCSDTVVVLLPNDGSDPVTYNILKASRQHRVLGRIKTGDWIGVVLNKTNKHEADIVIDLDQLKGIWCYIVMPQLRGHETMTKQEQAQAMRLMSDSLKNMYFIPREYGFQLKPEWQAQSVGYVDDNNSLAAESPVVFPPLGFFTGWHLWNGQLMIASGTPVYGKNAQMKVINPRNDTCSIDYLDDDSLVLSSDGESRSYYKKNNVNELNKKAQAIANKLKKEAVSAAVNTTN